MARGGKTSAGKKRGRMTFRSTLASVPAARLRAILADLPRAAGYRVWLKPLRWRTRPHLQALCDWGAREITVQLPEPFRPFREPVAYRAKRLRTRASRGKEKLAFRWFFRTVSFRTRTDVIRFLYCHEWYHYYLHDVLGRKGAAETACDRFALESFRRRTQALAGPIATELAKRRAAKRARARVR